MSQYKIVIDSCGELSEDLKADGHFCTVPLLLDVDGYQITDDETFNQRDFLQRVKAFTARNLPARLRSVI